MDAEKLDKVCPCCGGPLPDGVQMKELLFLRVTEQQRAILEVLVRAWPVPIYIADLTDRVYSDDPDGGPETAQNTVSAQLVYLRKRLAPYNWTVTKGTGRGSVPVSLQKIKQGNA